MIVAFVGQKGGVGKSTLAACVSAELVGRKRSVLLVDADPQQTAHNWHERGVEAGHAMPSVVCMPGKLHADNQVPKLAKGHDVTIIDTPARIAETLKSALVVADLAVLPCGPSQADVWALESTIEILREAQVLRPRLQAVICITRKRAGTVLGNIARGELEKSGLPVLASEIGDREAFKNTIGAGQGITTFAPQDRAAGEVRALVDELLTLSPKTKMKTRTKR
jgi:chromosome partitioning protein